MIAIVEAIVAEIEMRLSTFEFIAKSECVS